MSGISYYLIIDGMNGGVVREGVEGAFAVEGFAFDGDVAVSEGAVREVSRPEFSPLELSLPQIEAFPALADALARGTVIASARVVGLLDGDGGKVSEPLYSLELGAVRVSKLAHESGDDTLVLDYRQFRLTTAELDQKGMIGPVSTVSWNLETAQAPVQIPTAVASSSGPGTGMPGELTFYLIVDGVNGGSMNEDFRGAFEIDSYSLNLEREAIEAGGGGAGFGKLEASLDLDLVLGSGRVELLEDFFLHGGLLGKVRLVGAAVTGGDKQEVLYDLRLDQAVLSELNTNSAGAALHLDFARYTISAQTLDKFGTLPGSPPPTVGWDLVTGKALDSPLDEAVAGAGTATGSVPVSYYLFIDGLKGGVTAKGYEGAFAVDGYDIDFTHSVVFGSGGLETGKPEISGLRLEVPFGSAQAQLLGLVDGERIDAVRLVGTVPAGQGAQATVLDLRLAGAVLSELDLNGADSQTLGLSFERFTIETTAVDGSGKLGAPERTGWDLAKAQEETGSLGLPSLAGPAASAPTLDYFLIIDGANGGSLDQTLEGAFELSGFDLQIELPSSPVKGGGGAGSGSPDFSALHVDLSLDPGLVQLLAGIGDEPFTAKVVGRTPGEAPQVVYELWLGEASVLELHESSGNEDSLSLQFAQIKVVTHPLDSQGKPVSPTLAGGWDLAKNMQYAGQPPEPAPAKDPGGSPATTYYLQIDGIDGGSRVEGFEGAFELGSHELGVNLPAPTKGGGSALGAPAFGDLKLGLDLGAAAPALLQAVAMGKHLLVAQVVGVVASGEGKSEIVYDLRLDEVIVSSFEESSEAGDADRLDLSYRKLDLQTRAVSVDGKLGAWSEFTWDRSLQTAGSGVTATPRGPADMKGADAAPQNWYLIVDGVAGDVVEKGVAGAFAISGFEFGATLPVSESVGGADRDTGRPDFSGLGVDLSLGNEAVDLFRTLVSSKALASIRIVGTVDNGDGAPVIVYDLKLGKPVLVKVDERSGDDSDHLDFDFTEISLVTKRLDPKGALTDGASSAWSLETSSSEVNIPDPVPSLPPPNQAPEATDDTLNATESTGGSVDLLANDSDPDAGDVLALQGTGTLVVTSANVSIDGIDATSSIQLTGGTVQFTPGTLFDALAGNQAATITLPYTVRDDDGLQDSATLTITVQGENDAPVARDESALTGENDGTSIDLLSNDSDPDDGDTVSLGTVGAVTVSSANPQIDGIDASATLSVAGGTAQFTPGTLFDRLGRSESATLTLPYTVQDGGGLQDGATLTLTVQGANDAPVVGAPIVLGGTSGPAAVVLNSAVLLANASDIDHGDVLAVSGLSVDADAGTLAQSGPGSWSFTPRAGFVGTATFSYAVSDGLASVATSASLAVQNPIVAEPGQRVVNGTGGADTIVIGRTNQFVNAGAGDDTLQIRPDRHGAIPRQIDGGAGEDTLDLSAVTGGVRVNLANGVANGPFSGVSFLKGFEHVIGSQGGDHIEGNAGGNSLEGRAGDDVLRGGAGADTLTGGAGRDRLDGGAGPDVFVFDQASAGHADRVSDFRAVEDRILLDGDVFAALGGVGPLGASLFAVVGTAMSMDSHRLLYEASSGRLYYNADGEGAGAAVLIASFDGAPSLAASSILIG